MPLIPALLSANAHYKATKDRLADEAKRQAKLEERELRQTNDLLGDIDPQTAEAFRQALQAPNLGELPAIPRPSGDYPQYKPLSQRPKKKQ